MKAQRQQNQEETLLTLARERGMLRARDLDELGIARVYLRRLQQRGLLEPLSRGLYLSTEVSVTEHQSLIEIARRVPQGVVCLLSALVFHNFTTQNPHQIWLAVPNRARTPKLDYPPLRVIRMGDASLNEGVEEHQMPIGETTVTVRVTNPAKTIADCWKFRNKVGLDVAIEASRDAWRQRRFAMSELEYYAKINRVDKVMRPYLEAITFS